MERFSGHTNEYSQSTLMGNWFEDKLKADIDSKEMEQVQGSKNKELHQYQRKMAVALKPVTLSNASGRALKYGDIIMLQNGATHGVLSTDADELERVWRNGSKVLQSTTSSLPKYTDTAFARNSFVIAPPTLNKKKSASTPTMAVGDVLHYGQPFSLCIHSALNDTPFYLHSEIVSHLSSADRSRDQMVVFHPKKSSGTNWKFMAGDHELRVEHDTTPIAIHQNGHSEVIVQHCNTCSLLASDKIECGTDFGAEYQTSCNIYAPKKRVKVIEKELIGYDKDSRGELAQNKWTLIDAAIMAKKQ